MKGILRLLASPLACMAIVLCLFSQQLQAQAQLEPDFYDELVVDNQNRAVGVTFDANGRMYVWHQFGVVKLYENGQLLGDMANIMQETGWYGDHGLLGFALDPDFLNNGYYYMYYIVDQHHLLNYGTGNYDPTASEVDHATIGRVSRFTADPATNFRTTIPGSQMVLMGESISNGPPIMHISHSGGMIDFGDDGTLLVSTGDGSDYSQTDYGSASTPTSFQAEGVQLGIMRPQEDVGTFRAQMPGSYSGKVLRLDPITGEGLPSNPFYDAANPKSAESRVWALGFRQPFRISHVPGTGSTDPADGNPGHLIVGDVGGNRWEEVNTVVEGGQNFGWPLFEGFEWNSEFDYLNVFNMDAPNPLYGNGCNEEFFRFNELIKQAQHGVVTFENPCDNSQEIPSTIPTFRHSFPTFAYRNHVNPEVVAYVPYVDANGDLTSISIDDPNSPVQGDAFKGKASMGGVYYTGTNFPSQYQNSFFQIDFDGFVKNIRFDAQGNVTHVSDFASDTTSMVSMDQNPVDGNLYYVRYRPNQIRKIQYGGNVAPVAVAEADTLFGPSPLEVNFSALNSFDPAGDSISFYWDFGDGSSSTLAEPTHTFSSANSGPEEFTVSLRVSDSLGASALTEQSISLNNTPPLVDITSVEDGAYYTFPDEFDLNLEADVVDAEFEDADLTYEWETFLHHNTHFHAEPVDSSPITQVQILPHGCHDEVYWFRVKLTVTDPAGLSGSDEAEIFPWCNGPIFELLALEASVNQNEVDLTWQTRNEAGIVNYEIQRAGPDMQFRPYGSTFGSGTGNGPFDYSFTDATPLDGETWYRVKAIQAQGAFEFSPAVQMIFVPEGIPQIFPNPFEETLEVAISPVKKRARLEIFDVTGRLVYTKSWSGVETVAAELDMSGLKNGLYFYRLLNGSYLYDGRLVKSD